MSWEKAAYTRAGAALLSESVSGGALTITRALAGTEASDTDLGETTTLSGETHEVAILGIETVENDGKPARQISIQITGEAAPYICHQVGVYGRLDTGPDETLLFVVQDTRGIEIPAASTNSDFKIELAVLLAVSNSANISVTVSPQVQAIMQLVAKEIEKHNDDLDAHASVIEAAASAAVKRVEESGQIMTETQVKKLIRIHGSSGYFGKYELTLAADGWKATPDSGPCQYVCDIELADSSSDLIPGGSANVDDFAVAARAGVLNACETHDGFVRFFARRIPDADIHATLTLTGAGKGGGSNELVIATRDRPGCVRIGDGIDISEDGVVSAHATVSDEQIAATDDVTEMLKEIYDE